MLRFPSLTWKPPDELAITSAADPHTLWDVASPLCVVLGVLAWIELSHYNTSSVSTGISACFVQCWITSA